MERGSGVPRIVVGCLEGIQSQYKMVLLQQCEYLRLQFLMFVYVSNALKRDRLGRIPGDLGASSFVLFLFMV